MDSGRSGRANSVMPVSVTVSRVSAGGAANFMFSLSFAQGLDRLSLIA
jgi:hypothetical protein